MSVRKLFYIILFLSTCISPAYAYIDPGASSILLQGLIGGIAAGLTFLSVYYRKIKAKITRFICKPPKVEKESKK